MANKAGFTSDQEKEILSQALRFWDKSTEYMTPFFNLINDCERMWRAKLPKELEDEYAKHPDRAALAPPDVYVNIVHLRAALSNMIFGQKPYAQLSVAGQPNLRTEPCIKAEHLLQSMLDVCADGKGITWDFDLATHQACYAGITAVFTHWVNKYGRKAKRDDNMQVAVDPTTGLPTFEEVVIMSYAESKAVDIRHVRIDPSAERAENIRIVGYEYTTPLSDLLLKRRDEYQFYEFDEKEMAKSSYTPEDYYQFVQSERTWINKGDPNNNFGDGLVHCYDIRGMFQITQADGSITYEDLIVIVANKSKLIGVKRNDLPIYGWECWDFPCVEKEHGRLLNMGLVEPVMDAWIEKFVKRNQSLDESSNRTYDQYALDKNAAPDFPDVIERIPNQVHKVDLMAAGARSIQDVFGTLQKPATGQDTFLQSQSLERDIQKAMRLNDYVQGLNPQRQETATTADALVSGGKSALIQIARNLRDSYLKPCFRKQLILWNFFNADKQKTVYDKAGTPYVISPGDVDMFFEVDVDTSITVDRPGMIRRFVEMYPAMVNDPYYDPRAVRETAIDLLQLPNGDRLLPPDVKLKTNIARENSALMYGIYLPVIKEDEHDAHIMGHQEALQTIQQMPAAQKAEVNPQTIMDHINEHLAFREQINTALGNTKEMGGNEGNLTQPEGAAIQRGNS